MEKKQLYCCICGQLITKEGCPDYFGNNPDGAMYYDLFGRFCTPTFKEDDRCCDECDEKFVIPGRLYRLIKEAKGEN